MSTTRIPPLEQHVAIIPAQGPVASSDSRLAARRLRRAIAIWVNEGGAGGEVK